MKATHKISAVYYSDDDLIELTWEDIETGDVATLTTQVDRDDGEAISDVVNPCVYYGAIPKDRDELLEEIAILRDIIYGFNDHLLKMQADCQKYLQPGNTECGKDWFVSRMIYHLDGPEQRAVQGRLSKCRVSR